jgi:hypothetical protein
VGEWKRDVRRCFDDGWCELGVTALMVCVFHSLTPIACAGDAWSESEARRSKLFHNVHAYSET